MKRRQGNRKRVPWKPLTPKRKLIIRNNLEQRRNCISLKIPFDSHEDALSMPKRAKGHVPYQCKVCGKWHLTEKKGK